MFGQIQKILLEDGKLLLIDDRGNTTLPSAKEVYEAVFQNRRTINGLKLKRSFSELRPSLSFSKIPLSMEILILLDTENENLKIILRVQTKGDVKVIINPLSEETPDYVIEKDKWYPLINGIRDELKEILKKANIESPGVITVRQFFSLLTLSLENPGYINNTIPASKIDSLAKFSLKKEIDKGFNGQLYSYQKDGLNWLSLLSKESIGGILADEMGLGKTIQIIAQFLDEKTQNNGVNLLIVRTTLMENWRREIAKFAPDLEILIHHGSKRTGLYMHFLKHDAVITSYDTAVRDLSILKMVEWNLVILDEAQDIKNPDAERTKGIKELYRRVSIAVTGTPLENRLQDLWSIMDFAFQGYLGDRSDFIKRFENTSDNLEILESLVRPILLRRLVKEVASDLPNKIEIPVFINLSDVGSHEYESIRQRSLMQCNNRPNLGTLIKLRMYCCHPFLLEEYSTDKDRIEVSPKFRLLVELLEDISHIGEKVLVFTDYIKMIKMIKEVSLRYLGIYADYISGEVGIQDRQNVIDKFSAHRGPGVLVLNPVAGGAGLNITAANHVIHYNPAWNPAKEDQATARSFRRGQDKPVTVHRLLYSNTLEEHINDLLSSKRQLAERTIIGIKKAPDDVKNILKALSISPIGSNKHE